METHETPLSNDHTEDQIRSQAKKILFLSSEISVLKKSVDLHEKNYVEKVSEILGLNDQISQLNLRIGSIKNQHDDEVRTLHEIITKKDAEIARLQRDVQRYRNSMP